MRKLNIWTACCLTALLAACSTDTATLGSETGSRQNSIVTFTLAGQTRATTGDNEPEAEGTAASDNEKAVESIHVVVFKNHEYLTTATATEDDGTWTADLTESGAFDLYFVANASSDLVSSLTSCTDEASLFNTIAAQAPGDNSGSNPFLMTSDVYNRATDNTSGGTPIGAIELTRAVARIDVKVATALQASMKLTGITMKNRYVKTYFAQKSGQAALATATTGATADTPYTDDFGTGVTEYAQHIYGYENLVDGDAAAGTTVLTVEGTKDGVEFSHDIEFTNIPLKRNYHYVVEISPVDPTLAWSQLQATVSVIDWQTGQTLTVTNAKLTDRTETPAIVVAESTGTATIDDSADPVTVALADNGAATLTVTVTTTKSTLAKVVCKNQFEGFTIAKAAPTADADGTVTQVFTISLTANTSAEADRIFTFDVENQLKATLKKSITVTQPKVTTP